MAEEQCRPEFVCNTCLVSFPDYETMRAHYKTDWHIYNSRRKVAGLASISQAMWDEKWKAVANAKEVAKGKDHIKEKKEKDAVDSADFCQQKKKEKKEREPYEPNHCLFDDRRFQTVEKCLKYMRDKYSFTLSDERYIVDVPALLRCLNKLMEDGQCIYCGRYFSGGYYACRQHMVDSHHCRIGSENEEIMEILEPFYDFRTSIQEYKFKSKVKMEKVRRYLESVQNEDAQRALQQHLTKLLLEEGEDEIIESDGEEGEDWEEISEEIDDQELIRMAELPEDAEVVQCDDEDEFAAIMEELGLKPAEITVTGDLCLPNGKTVVHREMAYIYKQRGAQARAKRAEIAAKNQLMLGDGDKTKLHQPGGYAAHARQMMKQERSRNPFLKVATRAAKRDQKAVIAVLRRQQHDINRLWVNGAANGNIFKRRMDANMPHLLK